MRPFAILLWTLVNYDLYAVVYADVPFLYASHHIRFYCCTLYFFVFRKIMYGNVSL